MKKKKKPFEVSDPPKKNKAKRESTSNTTKSDNKQKPSFFADPGVRETIESIVVAVILALLFRAYEAEAFVIPTGSMAPTLQGRHVDIFCDECGYNFRVGASTENEDTRKRLMASGYGWITADATCPICRHTHDLDREFEGSKSNDDSFFGDRIIVSKFAYELSDPKRWDVIVFKYPTNPKQNYIKRLIGLPGETIKLEFGNVYVRNESGGFDIARKPHHKLKAMLQLVDDTNYISKSIKEINWPSRWNEWARPESNRAWSIGESQSTPQYVLSNTNETSWLRYRHVVPHSEDWTNYIDKGELPPRLEDFKGQLISDFYAYNYVHPEQLKDINVSANSENVDAFNDLQFRKAQILPNHLGLHWVADLAVTAVVEVKSKSGELLLDIVKSGTHYTCTIDVESGTATLGCDNSNVSFVSSDQPVAETPTAQTPIRGKGTYNIRYANVDDKLFLWVNEKVIKFDGPTEYQNAVERFPSPKYSANDAGDAEPIGIGGKDVELQVSRLQVLRDVYYTGNRTSFDPAKGEIVEAYEYRSLGVASSVYSIRNVLENPTQWQSNEARDLFSGLIHETPNYYYDLNDDQFMPLGDNSPNSQDSRAWGHGHFFDRKFLIGKALFIYWPHAWRQPFFFPNFRRMGFIR